MRLTEEYPDKYVFRANAQGKPMYSTKVIGGVEYKAVSVDNKTSIPNLETKLKPGDLVLAA